MAYNSAMAWQVLVRASQCDLFQALDTNDRPGNDRRKRYEGPQCEGRDPGYGLSNGTAESEHTADTHYGGPKQVSQRILIVHECREVKPAG